MYKNANFANFVCYGNSTRYLVATLCLLLVRSAKQKRHPLQHNALQPIGERPEAFG